MVFGIYAVDNDGDKIKVLRRYIADFVKDKNCIKSFHALYIEPETEKIYCDFIIDYSLRDWDGLKNEFVEYIKKSYPENEVDLTVETEFV